jgi:multisubunit Na+/H+ antiporter MnhB subunit
MEDVAFRLGTLFAVCTGSIGCVLAVLAWQSFRGAPFGRGLAILIPYTAAFTVYHALLVAVPDLPLVALAVESLAFVLVLLFVGSMARLHVRRLRKRPNEVPSR